MTWSDNCTSRPYRLIIMHRNQKQIWLFRVNFAFFEGTWHDLIDLKICTPFTNRCAKDVCHPRSTWPKLMKTAFANHALSDSLAKNLYVLTFVSFLHIAAMLRYLRTVEILNDKSLNAKLACMYIFHILLRAPSSLRTYSVVGVSLQASPPIMIFNLWSPNNQKKCSSLAFFLGQECWSLAKYDFVIATSKRSGYQDQLQPQ